MKKKKIAVIGGDARMIAAAEYLGKAYEIVLCGFDGREGGNGIVDLLCCSGSAEHPGPLDGFALAETPYEALGDCEAALLPLPALQIPDTAPSRKNKDAPHKPYHGRFSTA